MSVSNLVLMEVKQNCERNLFYNVFRGQASQSRAANLRRYILRAV